MFLFYSPVLPILQVSHLFLPVLSAAFVVAEGEVCHWGADVGGFHNRIGRAGVAFRETERDLVEKKERVGTSHFYNHKKKDNYIYGHLGQTHRKREHNVEGGGVKGSGIRPGGEIGQESTFQLISFDAQHSN